MELEKKIQKTRESKKKDGWMRELEEQSVRVSQFQKQMELEQSQDEMEETGANFNVSLRK